jgi:hypothetical protein
MAASERAGGLRERLPGVNRIGFEARAGVARGPAALGPTVAAPAAVAALAIGAVAIGAVAIGRLAIGQASIKRLEIEELEVGRLRVRELEVEGGEAPAVLGCSPSATCTAISTVPPPLSSGAATPMS